MKERPKAPLVPLETSFAAGGSGCVCVTISGSVGSQGWHSSLAMKLQALQELLTMPRVFWEVRRHEKTAQGQNIELSPKQIPLPLWILEKSQ